MPLDLTSDSGTTWLPVEGVPWLRDVHIVDTPGTNTLDASHTALTQAFLPRADLLLFVTSSDRPFSQSEATFLRAIQEYRKKMLFVLNKADLLATEAEVQHVLDYVAENAARELGERPLIVPAAARTALQLKERANVSELGSAALVQQAQSPIEVLAASQWSHLEDIVLRVIGSDARAAIKLQSQLALAGAVLGKCEERQAHEAALVARDLEVVAESRRRLAAWEVETRDEIAGQRARVKLVMSGLGERGQDFLLTELQLTNVPRLLRAEAFAEHFQRSVLADASDELQRAVSSVSSWAASRAAAQARATSEYLSAHLASIEGGGRESVSRGSTASIASTVAAAAAPELYQEQRQQLLLGLQQSARATITRYDPKASAERLLSAARVSVAQAAVLQVGAAGSAAVAAAKASVFIDITGLLPAALLTLTAVSVLPMQRYRLQRELRARTDELSLQLDRAVESHLEQELMEAVGRSAELITPFSVLAESSQAATEQRGAKLLASRASIDELLREARALARQVPA